MTHVCKGFLLDPCIPDTSCELVFDTNNEPYSCVLNQTDLKKNANKFYRMQALKKSSGFELFIRYGRIGENGVITTKSFPNSSSIITAFKTQFKSKTKNSWDDLPNFKACDGAYFLSLRGEKVVDDSKITTPPPVVTHNYHSDVVKFLNLISDREMLRNAMIKMDIDIEKMPLGKINISQLKAAKDLLLELQKDLTTTSPDDLIKISSKYYTYIPYACGRIKPPLIDSPEMISECLQRLDDIENISINVQVLQQGQASTDPLTDLYKSLRTEITPLPSTSPEYLAIRKYINNTHGRSHRFKLNLLSVLQIDRPESRKRYQDSFGSLPNKELLIHGSRMCNWVSILKNGLLLDPSRIGAVITGKMFGYGIYWANSFSKSAQYCGHSGSTKKEIVCFTLAEVALGNQYPLKSSESDLTWIKLQKHGDYQSTWGQGRNTPRKSFDLNGVSVPNGMLQEVSNPSDYQLLYDEKIVYNADQFDLRYIVLAEMNY